MSTGPTGSLQLFGMQGIENGYNPMPFVVDFGTHILVGPLARTDPQEGYGVSRIEKATGEVEHIFAVPENTPTGAPTLGIVGCLCNTDIGGAILLCVEYRDSPRFASYFIDGATGAVTTQYNWSDRPPGDPDIRLGGAITLGDNRFAIPVHYQLGALPQTEFPTEVFEVTGGTLTKVAEVDWGRHITDYLAPYAYFDTGAELDLERRRLFITAGFGQQLLCISLDTYAVLWEVTMGLLGQPGFGRVHLDSGEYHIADVDMLDGSIVIRRFNGATGASLSGESYHPGGYMGDILVYSGDNLAVLTNGRGDIVTVNRSSGTVNVAEAVAGQFANQYRKPLSDMDGSVYILSDQTLFRATTAGVEAQITLPFPVSDYQSSPAIIDNELVVVSNRDNPFSNITDTVTFISLEPGEEPAPSPGSPTVTIELPAESEEFARGQPYAWMPMRAWPNYGPASWASSAEVFLQYPMGESPYGEELHLLPPFNGDAFGVFDLRTGEIFEDTFGLTRSTIGALGTEKYLGMASIWPDVIFAPFNAQQLLVLNEGGTYSDPQARLLTPADLTAPGDTPVDLSGEGKWAGFVRPDWAAPMFGIPFNADTFLIVGENSDTPNGMYQAFTMAPPEWATYLSGSEKWHGPAAEGYDSDWRAVQYAVPYSSQHVIRMTDDAMVYFEDYGLDLSGTRKWKGAVAVEVYDDVTEEWGYRVIGIPYDAESFLVIDSMAGTASLETYGASLVGDAKYGSAIFARGPNLVLFFPENAGHILILDLNTMTTRTIPSQNAYLGNGKWMAAAGDGGIYYGLPGRANQAVAVIIDSGTDAS